MTRTTMMNSAATKTKTLKESVADRLRRDIICGELPPGMIIRDLELAQRYNASTSPVREALTLLTAEGLIEMPPNRPKQVAHIDRQGARELVAVFALLTIAAYESGAPRVNAEGVQEMREALVIIKQTAHGGDHELYIAAVRRYEDVIQRACGNRALRRLIAQTFSSVERISMLWRLQGMARPDVMENVVQALEAGDPQTAVALYRGLVEQFQQDVDALAPFL